MPILAGQIVTAGQLNRLKPTVYFAVGSAAHTGPATNIDITGAAINLVTEVPGATYEAECVWDADTIGTGAATGTARLHVDGANLSPLAVFSDAVTSDRGTFSQNYSGTLPAAGAHLFKLVASPGTDQRIQGVNCSIKVTIHEVV
ncbi:hypothetical protein [Streptomyces albipurpureus]|uniref:Uncharacterized protein n=1 Tax=Streptomyces albipurpureus TaxID=2897419 RepID=A0ABT0V0V4_9ACTN|nr:hypothetical protein [Streptomyces sp. CWNU-1]MCM2394366.1 hypothetical protein [Streptomyces sp. CWNU-1]